MSEPVNWRERYDYMSEEDLLTIEEFNEDKANRCLIPYDGDGIYATKDLCWPDTDVWNDELKPDGATHVLWFNR